MWHITMDTVTMDSIKMTVFVANIVFKKVFQQFICCYTSSAQ